MNLRWILLVTGALGCAVEPRGRMPVPRNPGVGALSRCEEAPADPPEGARRVPARSRGTRALSRALLDHGRDHGYYSAMKSVSKGALKAKMLEYFREVEQTGEELVVTDNNTPVLKVVPLRPRRSAAAVFADLRGRVVYREDVLAPTTDEWPET